MTEHKLTGPRPFSEEAKSQCGCWNSNEWPFPLNGKGYTFNYETGIGYARCMFCSREFDVIGDGSLLGIGCKLIVREETEG